MCVLSFPFYRRWLLFLVGGALCVVSFMIQLHVLTLLLSSSLLALLLTAGVELCKAMAIVSRRYPSSPSSYMSSVFDHLLTAVLRIGLLLLSLVCSLLFFTHALDRPQIEAIRATEIEALTQYTHDKIERAEQYYQQQIKTITLQKQQQEKQQALSNEMNHVVNGVFKGPRYLELERLLADEKRNMHIAIEQLPPSACPVVSACSFY